MNPEDALREFSRLADNWAPCYSVQVVTALAFRTNGKWQLRHAQRFFSSGDLEVDPLDIETASIRALRRAIPLDPSSAPAALRQMLSDPLRLAAGSEIFELVPGGGARADFYLHDFPAGASMRFPSLRAMASPPEAPLFPDSRALDLELYAYRTPFQGLADLLAELGLPGEASQMTHRPLIETVISPPAQFGLKSTFGGGALELRLVGAAARDPSAVRLGVKVFSGGRRPQRFSVEGYALEWQEDTGKLHARYKTQREDAPVVLALLSYAGDFLGQWWLRDDALSLNERLQIHRAVDNADTFRSAFFEKPDLFEHRVASLLNLLGLTVWHCDALAPTSDVPDLLAMTAARHLFVIECTVGDIDSKGKLQRLRNRSRRIAETLQASTALVTVQPVMITSLPRDDTAPYWNKAGAFKIALVCREEVQGLLDQLDVPPSPDQLYQNALSCIPPSEPPEPISFRAG
jgi:hypothetical protein